MNWHMIWGKVQEWAISFYNFVMTEGENDFMLVNKELLYGDDLTLEAYLFFLASFVLMTLFAIFASDSFKVFHPIEELREWKQKISIMHVIIFSAAVFSIHTFYKMLVALIGQLLHMDASVMALECLGTYINPITIMIYAYTTSTMHFRKKGIQAAFLGWSIFLTPSVMSFYGFTAEHVSIYIVGAVLGIVGGILYFKISPYFSCAILYAVYFVGKYFMINFSDEVILLSGESYIEKFLQYFACIGVDVILALILLLILFVYRIATGEAENIVKELRCPIVLAVLLIVSIVSANVVTVEAKPVIKPEKPVREPEKYIEVIEETESETIFVITASVANIRSGPGTEYGIITGAPEGTEFYGTGNENTNSSGGVWYEIYLNEGKTETGWASEQVIRKK